MGVRFTRDPFYIDFDAVYSDHHVATLCVAATAICKAGSGHSAPISLNPDLSPIEHKVEMPLQRTHETSFHPEQRRRLLHRRLPPKKRKQSSGHHKHHQSHQQAEKHHQRQLKQLIRGSWPPPPPPPSPPPQCSDEATSLVGCRLSYVLEGAAAPTLMFPYTFMSSTHMYTLRVPWGAYEARFLPEPAYPQMVTTSMATSGVGGEEAVVSGARRLKYAGPVPANKRAAVFISTCVAYLAGGNF